MQIVPRLATLGRVELIMTRPADEVATDDNFRNYPKSERRNKMTRRSVCVPLETNVDPSSGQLNGIKLPIAALLRTTAFQKPIRHRHRRSWRIDTVAWRRAANAYFRPGSASCERQLS